MLPLQLSKPSNEIIYDLLYYCTGVLFTKESLIFGTPVATEVPLLGNLIRDTKVELFKKAVPMPTFNPGREVYYARLDMAEYLLVREGDIVLSPGTFTSLDIAIDINRLLGFKLGPEDIEFEVFNEHVTSITLKAAPGSLVWKGEADIPIEYIRLELTPPYLTGFTPV